MNIMDKIEKCSICGKITKLSFDHVPPKCCGNNKNLYYISLMPKFIGDERKFVKQRHSQNGIKFQTICNECNNNLGAKYDKDLGEFYKFVIDSVNNFKYTSFFNIKNVVKGIIGHLLAASEFDVSKPADAMRDFYLNKSNLLLDEYTLMICYYPYKDNIFILKNYVPYFSASNSQLESHLFAGIEPFNTYE